MLTDKEVLEMSKDIQDWLKNPVFPEIPDITVTVITGEYIKPIDLLNKIRNSQK